MPRKTYLLTPGPTAIPESVSAVFAQPILHHRTPAFEKLFEGVRQGLQRLFQTKNEVLCLAATGSGAMEAAVVNLFSPGETVLVINAGKFGDRWRELGEQYGLGVLEVKLPAGEAIKANDIRGLLDEHPEIKAVLFQASETSTGVQMPTKEICAITRERGVLSVCDAITALGVFPLPMDEWGIDVLITGSQKALMIPPGLAMISLNDRAWAAQSRAKLPKYYFDLAREKKMHVKNQTSWTPAISLIQGLAESLRLIEAEGRETVYARVDLLARATRAAVAALGLELLAKNAPSPAVTAVKVPATIKDGKKIPAVMSEKFGVTITGGQDELAGKIFRLSHLGYVDRFDVTTGIAALELTLAELGHPVKFGTGVGAALEVFAKEKA